MLTYHAAYRANYSLMDCDVLIIITRNDRIFNSFRGDLCKAR